MIPTLLIVRHLGLIDTSGALIAPNLVDARSASSCCASSSSRCRSSSRRPRASTAQPARRAGQDRAAALGPGARHAGGDHVPVDVERLPVAAGRDQHRDHMTLQLGLSTFQGAHQTNWPILMAGNLLALAADARRFLFAPALVRPLDRLDPGIEGLSGDGRGRVPGGDQARSATGRSPSRTLSLDDRRRRVPGAGRPVGVRQDARRCGWSPGSRSRPRARS